MRFLCILLSRLSVSNVINIRIDLANDYCQFRRKKLDELAFKLDGGFGFFFSQNSVSII